MTNSHRYISDDSRPVVSYMMSRSRVLLVIALVSGVGWCWRVPDTVDLTHAFRNGIPFWAGDLPFNFTIVEREQLDDFWYEVNWFEMSDHVGTHLDSPAHMAKGKWRVHDIPLCNLIGPGVVIDVSDKARRNPDYQLDVNDVIEWERTYGQMPDGAMLMMNSGWSPKWPNPELVFGSITPDNDSTYHFPGLNPEAAQWIVSNRNISAFGSDTPSVDHGQSARYSSHVTLCKGNIIGLENVANLDLVPPSGAIIYAIPMKIYDGSGSPVRVFAILNDNISNSSSGILSPIVSMVALLGLVVILDLTF